MMNYTETHRGKTQSCTERLVRKFMVLTPSYEIEIKTCFSSAYLRGPLCVSVKQ